MVKKQVRNVEWGRRRSDNQAYPKIKPDKGGLPTGLSQISGMKSHARIKTLQPFGPTSDRLVAIVDRLGGNVDTTPESHTDEDGWQLTRWKYADFDDMESANSFAKEARKMGVWALVEGDNSVWLVSEDDPKEGWWEGSGRRLSDQEKFDIVANAMLKEKGLPLGDTSITGGPYEGIDEVPDRTYLYRVPFRTVGANRATDNLKIRATTKQNALGEANEILAERYPGGKFIIKSKSVRRLSE